MVQDFSKFVILSYAEPELSKAGCEITGVSTPWVSHTALLKIFIRILMCTYSISLTNINKNTVGSHKQKHGSDGPYILRR